MTMELAIWHGDWGLPSIDHNCLSVMAYCKFSEVPITMTTSNNPWKSPSGELPVLKHEDGEETKVAEIFNCLRRKNWGLDHELSTKQSADIVAFTALMEEKLVPALLHLWWVDAKTYMEFTRPWFSKTLPFPLNFYLPLKKHKDYVNYLNQVFGTDTLTEVEREQKLYKDAKECLNLLSSKLGDKEFFFGKSPSSLDAIVFGYLAPLLKAPFPSTALQNHLKACPNLCQICQRILNNHFPLSPEEEADLKKRDEEVRQKQEDSSEFPNKRRNMMVAGAVALTAMMGYAFLSGLVQIEVVDKGDNQDGQPPPPHLKHYIQDEGDTAGGADGRQAEGGEDEDNGNQ